MESIIKQFVTFEQACDLVDLGFKEDCLSIFSEGRLMCAEDPYCLGVYPYEQNKDKDDELIAPTYQQAFDFIYDKYGIHWCTSQSCDLDYNLYHFNAHLYSSQKFDFDIEVVDEFYSIVTPKTGQGFKSMQECRSAALSKILDKVTNNRIYDAP